MPSALPLPGSPPAAGGPNSSLPWAGRWEPLWGRGSSALGFPWPLASGKSALGEGTLLLASGQLLSQTKVQGRCLGPRLSRFGVQASEAQRAAPGRGGDRTEALEGGGGRPASAHAAFGPQAAEQWGGAPWTSLLCGLAVCARRVRPGHRALIRAAAPPPQRRGLLVAGAERRARRVRPPLVLVLTLPGTRGRKEVPGSLSLVPQSPSRGCG